MRLVTSTILLLIFLFLVGGHEVLFWGLRVHHNQTLSRQFDYELYSDSEIITLHIPINLPYPVVTWDYQRLDGSFDYNGVHYKLVKQKFENDTLTVVCYRDDNTLRLNDIFNEFTRHVNDLPTSSKNTLNFMGKMMKDYMSEKQHIPEVSLISLCCLYHPFQSSLLTREKTITTPPPELAG